MGILPNLVDGNTYFVRAYATNSLGTAYGQQISFSYHCGGSLMVTDYEGKTYNTVRIGDQCWMKENLRSTRYSDGTPISNWTIPSGTGQYGVLYSWQVVMRNASSSNANPSGVQGICPTGWHVPSNSEWSELAEYVRNQSQYLCSDNMTTIAKALADSIGWSGSSNACAVGNNLSSNNATGFSALPAGSWYSNSTYNFGSRAYFWTSVQDNSSRAYYRYLDYSNVGMYWTDLPKDYRLSVRCLRD